MATAAGQFLLIYKALTGEAEIDEISADGQNVSGLLNMAWTTSLRADGSGFDNTMTSTWSADWSSLVPMAISGRQFLLSYKASTGEMALDRVRPDGSGVDTLLSRIWAKDWSIFSPFVLGGVPHQLVYRATDGTAATDKIW